MPVRGARLPGIGEASGPVNLGETILVELSVAGDFAGSARASETANMKLVSARGHEGWELHV